MFSRMFEGLEWKNAFKRAAVIFAIWLASIYALSTAFPSFDLGLDSSAGIFGFAINAALFFLFFVVLTAFFERSKKRSLARRRPEQKAGKKGVRSAKATARTTGRTETSEDGEEGVEATTLKGRHNPNTSRKKAARRRRR